MLAELPDWDWSEISAHPKCTARGKVGWGDTRLDWGEVIDFNKGVGAETGPIGSRNGVGLKRPSAWCRIGGARPDHLGD